MAAVTAVASMDITEAMDIAAVIITADATSALAPKTRAATTVAAVPVEVSMGDARLARARHTPVVDSMVAVVISMEVAGEDSTAEAVMRVEAHTVAVTAKRNLSLYRSLFWRQVIVARMGFLMKSQSNP